MINQFWQGYLASVLVMAVILIIGRWVKWGHGPASGIQNIHEGAIPRVGGLAIVLGTWFSIFSIHFSPALFSDLLVTLYPVAYPHPLSDTQALPSSANLVASYLNPLILMVFMASSSIFLIGFLEDITGALGVRTRLILTIIPGILLAFFTGICLTHLGISGIDTLLTHYWFAIFFTGFALAGMTHAFNMIDGLNGLVAWMSLWILGAFLVLASLYDDHLIAQMGLLLMAPVLGFLFFNWPLGKCFLGDGGAYFLGFTIAWLGVALVARHPQISPFAPPLICAYPLAEAFFSIGRRMLKKQSSGTSDREHLHQIFLFGVVQPYLSGPMQRSLPPLSRRSNSIAGLLISLLPLPFMVLACLFSTNQPVLVAGVVGACIAYGLLYGYGLKRCP